MFSVDKAYTMKKVTIILLALIASLGCYAKTTIEIVPYNSETVILKDSNVRSIVFNLNGEINVNDLTGDSFQLTSDELGRIQFLYTQGSKTKTIKNEPNVAIVPNPVKDIVTITNLKGKSDMKIFSANGTLIHQFLSSEKEQKIDVSSLPTGVYYLVINNKECLKFQKE